MNGGQFFVIVICLIAFYFQGWLLWWKLDRIIDELKEIKRKVNRDET